MQSRSVLVAALAVLGANSVFAQQSAPLVQKANLVYKGAFRLPQGTSETTTFNYGGTAATYNPANNSLFLTGHDWNQRTAELKIPAIVNSTDINNLQTASLLQNFADSTEGKLGSINASDPNSKKIGGNLVYNNKLYVTAYSFYDGSGTQSASHFVRPLSLSTTGQVQGPYKVGSDVHYSAGYMTLVPPEWRSLLGGPALTGLCCLAIASVQSNGPSVSVFDPAQVGGTNAATRLLGYPLSNPLGPGSATTNSSYNLATQITGVVFPVGTRSVLFFGRQGTGTYCYGDGSTCGDRADSSKGVHAYPYRYQVWAYDANDLLAVKNGSKQQYQVQPYAMWAFNLPFENSGDMHQLGGAAYDAQTAQIYLVQRCADTNCAPVVHVFKVDSAATIATPQPPTSVSAQ